MIIFYMARFNVIGYFINSGQSANPEERKSAMKVAEQFIKDKNYPKNTQVIDVWFSRLIEVSQSAKF